MTIMEIGYLRYFSGYYIFGLWNIAKSAVAPYVFYPPDIKHQEDVLDTPTKKSTQVLFFVAMVYLYVMKYIFLSFLYLAVLFGVSHFIFEPTYLYYEFEWLDIPMHILGGIGVGFLAVSIMRTYKISFSFVHLFVVFFVVATAWELYEYMRGVMVYDTPYKYLDTVKDYMTGSAGLLIAYLFIRK